MSHEIIRMLWEIDKDKLFISEQDYFNSFSNCELTPIYTDNVITGVVITKGAEIHYQVFGKMVITKAMMRQFLADLILKYGFAFTRVPKDNIRQQRLNERIGFFKVGEDEFDIHYRVERIRNL